MNRSLNPIFVDAAKNSDIYKMGELILQGTNINSVDDEGKTALLVATENENPSVVQWLLEHGADVDYHDQNAVFIDKTPFLYAGANGLNEILDLLIEYNPDTSILNGYGGTALIPACERGYLETVKKLLQKTNIDINHINRLGWTALMETIILGDGGEKYQKIVEVLLSYGANHRISDFEGVSPLNHAKRRNYHEIVKILESYIKDNSN